MRSEQEVNRAIEMYSDMVYRLCMVYMKNTSDTEDIFQDVFLKYALSSVIFENSEHEKAWIIRVTVNRCKDVLKSFFRNRTVSIEEFSGLAADQSEDYSEVIAAVLSLPIKYKEVVYLYYFEDYPADKIGKILNKNVNTVYTLLARARTLLKEKLEGEENAK